MVTTPTDPANPPTVDVHAHVLVPAADDAVAGHPGLAEHRGLEERRNGTAAQAVNGPMVAERVPRMTDASARLSAMDNAGVDIQLVSPVPAHYHYWAPPPLAERVCRLVNEHVAEHCALSPRRLVGLGVIPLQHPDLVVPMLEHAVAECGLAGVELAGHAPGVTRPVELSDPRLEPLWARAAELGAVLFLHPFGCTLDERLDQWYLSNSVGQPAEHAVALSHLVFAGVLDRHPGLRLLAAHGGGYLPTHVGRADHAWHVRPDARGCAEAPSTYLRRMWFDSVVHDPAVLRHLVEVAGPDRVLLGSDFPFDMGTEEPLAELRAAGLPIGTVDAIRGGNAAALLAPHTH